MSENKIVTENDGINTLDKATNQTADLISSIARNTEGKLAAKTDCSSKMPHGNDMKNDSLIDMPSQELGLRISKTTRSGTEIQDEGNIVKRSDLSAFTRCKT
jgi:pseudo-response regulator 7